MAPSIKTALIYAIGDIHGRDDLLARMHARITAHNAAERGGRPATIIHLGDYVDRGRRSDAVLDRLMAGVDGFETLCLMGNHEDMMLECCQSDASRAWDFWKVCGAQATLEAFGVAPHTSAALSRAVGPARLAWLRARPLTLSAPGYLFVHAGIVPGFALQDQPREDLIWIRDEFLDCEADHGFRVVHGHTPTQAPVLRHNRIGIDTGVVINGRLTAVVLDDGVEPEFLTVEGPRGAGP